MDFSFLCFDIITLSPADQCYSFYETNTYLDWLIDAWGWTLIVAINTLILALILGSLVGTIRTLKSYKLVVLLGNLYVEIFRNIPILVQVFLWYHVVPYFIPAFHKLPGFILVVFALGFYASARISEHIKSGVDSLSKDQLNAAKALGMTTGQAYRYVLLPTTFRIIIPSLTSEMMSIVKNSSVAFAVSVAELTQFAMQVQEEVAHGIEIYFVVTLLYMISALAIYLVMSRIEKRVSFANQGLKDKKNGQL